MNINSHITDFIDYYVKLKNSPNYAVLLSGAWGSGKSWFIKNYIESKKNNKKLKFLYVSLYGINSFEAIEQTFFKELHPLLASNEMKVAKAIFKGIMKATIKVDLDINSDSKTDLTATSGSIPDIELLKSLKNIKDCVLVFDDLERCPILLHSILGYINQLVENEGIKAIIIANEEEIGRKNKIDSEEAKLYRIVKEKVIGKTFLVKTDTLAAITSFIDHVDGEEYKNFLKKKINLLINIFGISEYNNLRHLRHGVLDFEMFYKYIPKSSLKKSDLIDIILQSFFAINFELKKGSIQESEIEKLTSNYYLINRKNDSENDEIIKIYSKYGFFGRENPISANIWSSFFKDFSVDADKIKSQILQSVYYKENTPDWILLSHFISLSQEEFNSIFSSVYDSFSSLKYDEKETIVYVVRTLMYLSDKGIIDIPIETIYSTAMKNIENLKKSGKLDLRFNETFYIDMQHNFIDSEHNVEEFSNFLSIIKLEAEQTKNKSLNREAESVLSSIGSSLDDVYDRLVINVRGNSDLYKTPVLKYIDEGDFLNMFWKLSHSEKSYLGRIFYKRYESNECNKHLISEHEWLKRTYYNIKSSNSINSRKVDKYSVENYFLPNLKLAMDRLESSKD